MSAANKYYTGVYCVYVVARLAQVDMYCRRRYRLALICRRLQLVGQTNERNAIPTTRGAQHAVHLFRTARWHFMTPHFTLAYCCA
jgi:hypothetical protein